MLMKIFDHLRARGFRAPMQFVRKPLGAPAADQAHIVDLILRVAGYPLATFLLRDELRESGRLTDALATCRELERRPDNVGNLFANYLQADAVRVVLFLGLPAALAADDGVRLSLITEQIERSLALESNDADTVKPDGLGHHHLGVYMGAYAGHTVSQAAFATWLFRGTSLAMSPQTIANIAHGLATHRLVAQKYDLPQALGGRFAQPTRILPKILMGFAYLADLDHPRRAEFQGILARLADDAYMATSQPSNDTFQEPDRNEIPPGAGAISFFLRTLEQAKKAGAEATPQGHWSFNYGPLAIHRRKDWMVSVKGHSRYWWAMERTADENAFGYHDGSASMQIFNAGSPVNAYDSGYRSGGWDWSRIPGTTARYLSPKDLVELDARGGSYTRPRSDAVFVGGLSLEGRHGIFAMDYTEISPDIRATPLRALKTWSAKIGSRMMASPNSTPSRSSSMAPHNTRLPVTKRTPPARLASIGSWSGSRTRGAVRIAAIISSAITSSTPTTP
jgi:chondroitin-sulfate-ABC endolyase/exolyase